MRRKRRPKHTAAVLALLAAAGSPLAAGDRGETLGLDPVDLVRVEVFEGGMDLTPGVPYERAIVTVSGMERIFRLEFDAYTRPTIGPFAPNGDLLADGVYQWELELVPDAASASRLRESASAKGDRPHHPWLPESGSFALRGGSFALPDLTEASERSEREKSVAAERGGPPGIAVGPLSTRPDSDREAERLGASAESVPRAGTPEAEASQQSPRPRSDGSDGRPRSDH